MEQKKELLIKVLKKMQPYRDMATGILALIESSYVDEKTIDGVIYLISQSIKTVKQNQSKTRMEKTLIALQKIKHAEEWNKEDIEWFLDNL